MSHTPGPWVLDRQTSGWQLLSNGADIMAEPFDCADADASLIAAAPELLAALKDVCRFESVIQGMNPSAWPVIHAAIARAEGRAE